MQMAWQYAQTLIRLLQKDRLVRDYTDAIPATSVAHIKINPFVGYYLLHFILLQHVYSNFPKAEVLL